MNKNNLKREYDKLVADIKKAIMFDGREKGVDRSCVP